MSDSGVSLAKHEGWLWKWTNYVSGYQKRWFVLSNGVLSYFLSQDDVKEICRGQVSLKSTSVVADDSSHFTIQKGSTSFYHLRADSAIECERWMKALELSKATSMDEKGAENLARLEMSSANSLTDPSLLLRMKQKFSDLEAHTSLITKRGSDILFSFSEIEQEITKLQADSLKNDKNAKIKEAKESAILFRITSEAMVTTCSEFLQLAKNQIGECQKISEFYAKPQLLNAFEDASDDESEFLDASDAMLDVGVKQNEQNDQTSTLVTSDNGFRIFPDPLLDETKKSKYRASIPLKPEYKLELWSILKHLIGRDISKFAVPVNFNDPLSMLQRLAEELESSELLDSAATCTDSAEQMAHVMIFATAAYSTTADRMGKPFNPMLGETFELDCEEKGFRTIAEQVSHHPPVAAYHVESTRKKEHGGWSYWQEVTPHMIFRGYYAAVKPIGTCHLVFHKTGHHYTWNKVCLNVNNIIIGNLWIDQSGVSVFTNHTTGEKSSLTFYPYSYLSTKNFRKVSGTVIDKDGIERFIVSGTWDKSMSYRKIDLWNRGKEEEVVLWKVNPKPTGADKMYNFTRFTMILNEWEDGTAPTDSRRRPDQRKMEEGEWDEANSLKMELEERQRYRRKLKEQEDAKRKAEGLPDEPHEPRWFKKEICPLTGENSWTYQHEYWEAKEKQDWSRCVDIFDLTGQNLSANQKSNWPDIIKSARAKK